MEKKQLTQFTFFDLYTELMDTLTDEERGKMLRAMCEFMFKDDAQTELTDKKLLLVGEHHRLSARGQNSAGKRQITEGLEQSNETLCVLPKLL